MLVELRVIERQMAELSARFDAAATAVSDCAEIVGLAVKVERLAAAIRLPAAARATSTPLVWAADGSTSPSEWLAGQTGRSTGAAYTELQTAELLGDLPDVADSVQSGALSVDQAAEIAAAAAVAPDATEELLDAAGKQSFKQLRDRARGLRRAARSPEELEAARFHQRRVRMGTNDLGAFVLRAEGPSADRVRMEAALSPTAEELFRADQSSGHRRTHDQRLYDALMITTGARSPQDPGPGDSPSPRRPRPRPPVNPTGRSQRPVPVRRPAATVNPPRWPRTC